MCNASFAPKSMYWLLHCNILFIIHAMTIVVMALCIIAQMVLCPLLGLKNVSTLTLLALCKEIVAILVDIIKHVILRKLHTRPTFYLII